MTTTDKQSANARSVDTDKPRPYDTVGAGNWLVSIFKEADSFGGFDYRLKMERFPEVNHADGNNWFLATDILHLPKLVQVLAAALVQDGWLEQGLKDDLACLASLLDWFLTPCICSNASPWVTVKRETLMTVVDYLWDNELTDFRTAPPERQRDHIFHELVTLNAFAEGRLAQTGDCNHMTTTVAHE
jgi:hypothetical protein